MCGILGALPAVPEYKFRRSLDIISHRGPDGSGIWHCEKGLISLGHRRLAIIDLSERGKQPFHYEKYVITYNGEIYNFLEVKRELISKGYSFQSESDTEIVLTAFHEWRENCLHKFNGMWSLGIWDKDSNSLFLSRDRFGKKPLFYTFTDGRLIFASEMKALFPFLPALSPSVDFEWCSKNIFDYEQTDKCLIDGIKRFPAGHYAYFHPGENQINPVRFWNTLDHLEEVPSRYQDQVERFRELFIDACRIRMRSDVPIGTALSGGLDSSATISTMAHVGKENAGNRTSKDWQHAFVASFPGSSIDESYYAQKVVDHIGIKATFLPVNPEDSIKRFYEYQFLFEELYITSPIPMMDLYRNVRQNGITVTIDGHGSDELFCGYANDVYKIFLDIGFDVPGILDVLRIYKGMIGTDLSVSMADLSIYWKYMKYNKQGGKNVLKHYLSKLLSSPDAKIRNEKDLGHFNGYLFQIFHHTILPTLLRNYDRYSMASGVEIRMPFMDHRLVTYCFSLPFTSKVGGGFTKRIVRDALKHLLPDEVVWRKRKIGFNTPMTDWVKSGWKNFFIDEISSSGFNQSLLIDREVAKRNILDLISNKNASFVDGEKAWISIMPYFWEKAVLKSDLYKAND